MRWLEEVVKSETNVVRQKVRWMCMEVEVEGLRMVGEIGEDVPKGVGSGD